MAPHASDIWAVILKKLVAGVLLISAAACFHNTLFSLSADLLVPARSLVRSWPMYAFFLVIVLGGGYGGIRLWDRGLALFGVWLVVIAGSTLTAMVSGSETVAPPTTEERLSGFLAEGVVIACAVVVLLREARRLRAATGMPVSLLDVVLLRSPERLVEIAANKAFLSGNHARAAELCTQLVARCR
jgi:hypothetical protein